jgi:hypothetical protein
MGTPLLSEKYAAEMVGVLNCYDRVIIRGNLQPLCYAQGMTKYLYEHKIRIFSYGQFAVSLRDEIRQQAEAIAAENQIEIEFIRKSQAFRKEERIQAILRQRGQQPGLVHIFAAMERCPAYRPWHDKTRGKTYVKSASGKCLHYYFYFIDEELGLCYLRVPTWCPFGLQFYFNGHNWLAGQLAQHKIAFEQRDNAFVAIADFDRANQLAAQFKMESLQAKLDQVAQAYCPVVAKLGLQYHWSILQAEYATDLIFKSAQTLQAFFPLLLATLIQAVQPADIATFLGRKLHGNYQGEAGSRYNHHWLGRRIKHQLGPVTIKMYDKFNLILRIETSVADVSFFQQYRPVHHRDGSTSLKWTAMKKTIYSLPALQEQLLAANQRYLKFISAIETAEVGVAKLHQLAETRTENEHRYKGFNLFAEEDASLFRTLLRGEFFITGFTNKALQPLLPHKNSAQITRLLARLRVHHLIKKVGQRYKYYLTDFGRQVVTMALKLREMVVIPGLASNVHVQV